MRTYKQPTEPATDTMIRKAAELCPDFDAVKLSRFVTINFYRTCTPEQVTQVLNLPARREEKPVLTIISVAHHEDKIFPMLSEAEKQDEANKARRREEVRTNIAKADSEGKTEVSAFWKFVLQKDVELYG